LSEADVDLRQDQENEGRTAQVVIERHGQLYVTIHSETAIQQLISNARVGDWEGFKCLWVPVDFYTADCRVMAGVRRDTTHIERMPLV